MARMKGQFRISGQLVGLLAFLLQAMAGAQQPPFVAARLWDLAGTETDATGFGVLVDLGSPGGGARDGFLDLVAPLQSQQLIVLFGLGDGSFSSSPQIADIQGIPAAVASADFDEDGVEDIAIGDSSNFLRLLRYRSGSVQAVGNPVDLQFLPRGLAVGDFDGDRHLDLVAVGDDLQQSGRGRVLFGNGDGTFTLAAETLPVASGSSAVATADFNGDGHLDLAVVNELFNRATQFRGDGRGGFVVAQNMSTGGEGPGAVAVADANGDGRPDVFVLHTANDTLAVGLTQANGEWAAPRLFAVGAPASSARGLALGDVNADGKVDAVVANNFSFDAGVLFGDGRGGFSPVRLFVADAEPLGVLVGDLNRDQRADVVVLTRGGGNRPTAAVLLSGTGNELLAGENVPLQFSPVHVSAGDLDGDGLLDMSVSESGQSPASGSIQVATGTGDGSRFDIWDAVALPSDVLATVAGDFDGDLRVELAVVHSSRAIVGVYRPARRTLSRLSETTFPGANPKAAVAADFNRDGRTDLAIALQGASGGIVQILLGAAGANFAIGATVNVGDFPLALAVGDFDRDGIPDFVSANSGSLNFSVARGNGDGTFQPATSVGLPQAPRSLAVADFDRDGFDDIAVGVPLAGTVNVYFGDGRGRFPASINPLAVGSGEVPSGVAARDINGDGLPDIVASGEVGSIVRVFLRSGSANARTFANAGTFRTNRRPLSLVVGDFTADGRHDAAAAASSPAPTTTVLRNATATAFRRGDADGDGRAGAADIVALARVASERRFLRAEDAGTRGSHPLSTGADADGDGTISTLDLRAVMAWAFR